MMLQSGWPDAFQHHKLFRLSTGSRQGQPDFILQRNKHIVQEKQSLGPQKVRFSLGHRCQDTRDLLHRGSPRYSALGSCFPQRGAILAGTAAAAGLGLSGPGRWGEALTRRPRRAEPHRTDPRHLHGGPRRTSPAAPRPRTGLDSATGRSRRLLGWTLRRPSEGSSATALPLSEAFPGHCQPPPPGEGTPAGWVPARPSPHRKRARKRAPAPAPPPRRGLTGSQLQAAVPPAAPQRPLPALQDVVVLSLEQLHPRTPPRSLPPPGRRECGRAGRSRRSAAARLPRAHDGRKGEGRKGEGLDGARSRAEHGCAHARCSKEAGESRRPCSGEGRFVSRPRASSGSGPAAARDAACQRLAAHLKVQRGAGRELRGAGLPLARPSRSTQPRPLSHPPRREPARGPQRQWGAGRGPGWGAAAGRAGGQRDALPSAAGITSDTPRGRLDLREGRAPSPQRRRCPASPLSRRGRGQPGLAPGWPRHSPARARRLLVPGGVPGPRRAWKPSAAQAAKPREVIASHHRRSDNHQVGIPQAFSAFPKREQL